MERKPISPPVLAPRAPETVMRLARLGASHQSRLSFMRILTRRMAQEAWQFTRTAFDIDAAGVGHAVYQVTTPQRSYALVAFSHDLPPDLRSDRVIATAWDATFALFDGTPTADDIDRLAQNVPLQEAGRITEKELVLSRANRSGRVWAHVIDSLAAGRQPDARRLRETGYLMRTTAVYGSGKFGAADYAYISERSEFSAPFQAEMLTVYLIRLFVRDLANHLAQAKGGGTAVRLDDGLAQDLGIGNATGLGLAPFFMSHPRLMHNWIAARETALARVRALPSTGPERIALFRARLDQMIQQAARWETTDRDQHDRLVQLRGDLAAIRDLVDDDALAGADPWDRLYLWGEAALSLEGQECLASLMLEPHGDLVDDLADTMAVPGPEHQPIDGRMTVGTLKHHIREFYGWALSTDWSDPQNYALAWYTSADKMEPRLGNRFDADLTPYEQPMAPGRDAALLFEALTEWSEDARIAEILVNYPVHRSIVRRIQTACNAPYSELRDNTISADLHAVDLLRCILSFFGATRFDPKSDRWLRICMYAGAPFPERLTAETADGWPFDRMKK